MKTARNIREEMSAAKNRLVWWEANKYKYPNNTDWWQDFHLSPNHAESKQEAHELLVAASDEIASEKLEAEREAAKQATLWEVINKRPEASRARSADRLRIFSFNLGNIGVILLLLYFVLRLAGWRGVPILDTLWPFCLVGTPLCYLMAIVFAFRAESLWKKAQEHGKRLATPP